MTMGVRLAFGCKATVEIPIWSFGEVRFCFDAWQAGWKELVFLFVVLGDCLIARDINIDSEL